MSCCATRTPPSTARRPRAAGASSCSPPRDELARDQAGVGRELVDDLEPAPCAFLGIDDHREDGRAAAQLQQAIAMWLVVAVVPPDPAQAGRAGSTGLAQRTDHVLVLRRATVDHELLQEGPVRRSLWLCQAPAI